jgi:hypothetical protein
MAKSQKEAVVEEVMLALPTFVKGKDNAILKLNNVQLESIKSNIKNGIINGLIEYSKDVTNHTEVRTYARSMVMNHLKKAKELNGGAVLTTVASAPTSVRTVRSKVKLAPKGVNASIMPEELQEYARSLVQ